MVAERLRQVILSQCKDGGECGTGGYCSDCPQTRPGTCDHCGQPFTRKRPHQKYCGAACRLAAHRDRVAGYTVRGISASGDGGWIVTTYTRETPVVKIGQKVKVEGV